MKLTTKVVVAGILFIAGAFWFSFSYFPGEATRAQVKDDKPKFSSKWFPDEGIDVVVIWNPMLSTEFRRVLQDKAIEDEEQLKSRLCPTEAHASILRALCYVAWSKTSNVVPDGATPLGVDLEKVDIIEYSSILPPKALPTFSPEAVLWSVTKIAGLSEKFVLLEPGVFLGGDSTPDLFVSAKTGALRIEVRKLIKILPHTKGALQASRDLVGYKLQLPSMNDTLNLFGPMLYDKNILDDVIRKYSDEIEKTRMNRWPNHKTLIMSVVYRNYYMEQGDKSSDTKDAKKYLYSVEQAKGTLVTWPARSRDVPKALRGVRDARPSWFWVCPRIIDARYKRLRNALEAFFFEVFPKPSPMEFSTGDYSYVGLYLGLTFASIIVCGCYVFSHIMGVKRSKDVRFSS